MLKLPNDDIDVALNDTCGVDFAQWVNEYMVHIGRESDTKGIVVIQVDYTFFFLFFFESDSIDFTGKSGTVQTFGDCQFTCGGV